MKSSGVVIQCVSTGFLLCLIIILQNADKFKVQPFWKCTLLALSEMKKLIK